MNREEIEFVKTMLPPLTKCDCWTNEQKMLNRELSCREMINSCLIYGTDFLTSHYKDSYIEELGEKRVNELYNEQLKYCEKCKVNYNVYEDSEGVTYNSLTEPENDGYIHCEIIGEPIFNKIEDTNETFFSIKVKDQYNNCFDVGLSSDVDNDYRNYYDGRKIGLKIINSFDNVYKTTDVQFFDKVDEYEI